jgi:hypothetical protein
MTQNGFANYAAELRFKYRNDIKQGLGARPGNKVVPGLAANLNCPLIVCR